MNSKPSDPGTSAGGNTSGSFPIGQTILVPSVNDIPTRVQAEPSPAVLADLMIAALLRPAGGLVSLDPDGASAVLALRRGNATIEQLVISADVAAAAIGRLARMAGLDPLAERGSLIG